MSLALRMSTCGPASVSAQEHRTFFPPLVSLPRLAVLTWGHYCATASSLAEHGTVCLAVEAPTSILTCMLCIMGFSISHFPFGSAYNASNIQRDSAYQPDRVISLAEKRIYMLLHR